MATLEQAINEASGHVDDLIRSMVDAEASDFELNFADKVLRPAIFGIIAGHAAQVQPEDVENAICDTFTSIVVELLKRTHKNRIKSRANADEAAIHAQQLINQMAKQLTDMIEQEFGPKVQLARPN